MTDADRRAAIRERIAKAFKLYDEGKCVDEAFLDMVPLSELAVAEQRVKELEQQLVAMTNERDSLIDEKEDSRYEDSTHD